MLSLSQPHWKLTQAVDHPKPAKELDLPAHEQIEYIKHETLTINIHNTWRFGKFEH